MGVSSRRLRRRGAVERDRREADVFNRRASPDDPDRVLEPGVDLLVGRLEAAARVPPRARWSIYRG
jgi:hypothetical protein